MTVASAGKYDRTRGVSRTSRLDGDLRGCRTPPNAPDIPDDVSEDVERRCDSGGDGVGKLPIKCFTSEGTCDLH